MGRKIAVEGVDVDVDVRMRRFWVQLLLLFLIVMKRSDDRIVKQLMMA